MPVLAEAAVDLAADLVDRGVAVGEFAHMHAQLVVERAGAEGEQEHQRRRVGEHARVVGGDLRAAACG